MTDNTLLKSSNTVWHNVTVSRAHRELQNGHKSVVLWFTGLSGAGKSTLAQAVEEYLHTRSYHTIVLDGDNVRHGLCSNLGFSDDDREENIRRIGEVAKLFLEGGVITLTAFISPFTKDREKVRDLMPDGDFIEIYCKADLQICESRDVKGLYQKARAGTISHFTGISSPYEEPEKPELVVDTGTLPLQQCVYQVIQLLRNKAILPLEPVALEGVI
jgi:adenylylsulfate kinase